MKHTKACEKVPEAALEQSPFLTEPQALRLYRAFLQAHGIPLTPPSTLSQDRDNLIGKHRAGVHPE